MVNESNPFAPLESTNLVPLNNSNDQPIEPASNFTIIVLLAKGMMGLAIIMLPTLTKNTGYAGYFFGNLITGVAMVYLITLIISVSVAIGYTGKSYGEIHEIILGRNTRWITDLSLMIAGFCAALGYVEAPRKIFEKI
jgi:amino acid permease